MEEEIALMKKRAEKTLPKQEVPQPKQEAPPKKKHHKKRGNKPEEEKVPHYKTQSLTGQNMYNFPTAVTSECLFSTTLHHPHIESRGNYTTRDTPPSKDSSFATVIAFGDTAWEVSPLAPLRGCIVNITTIQKQMFLGIMLESLAKKCGFEIKEQLRGEGQYMVAANGYLFGAEK